MRAVLAAAFVAVASVCAPRTLAAQSEPERRLDFLLGDWVTADTLRDARGSASGTGTGRIRYTRAVGDRWLVYDFTSSIAGLGAYAIHGATSWSPSANAYQAVAISNLGNLLTYVGWWANDSTLVFELASQAQGKKARVTYERRGDTEVRFSAEREAASGAYEVYFVSTLRRSGA